MDELLPTPQTVNRKSERAMRSSAEDGGNGRRSGGGQSSPPGLEQVVERISVSSPGSEDSTSESKPLASAASARSSGIEAVPLFSSDGGPMSPDGETSPGSPLLPTPNAQNFNDGQTTEAWRERKTRERAKGYNGNGGGTPIAMAVRLIAEGMYDPNRDDRISSAGDSPASPSATRAGEAGRRTSDTSGLSSTGSSSSSGRGGSSSRTFQVCSLSDGRWVTEQATLLGSMPLATFSETWPKRGSMRSGVIFERQPSEPLIGASEPSSSLNVPTPTASDSIWAERDSSRNGIVGNHNLGLVDWVRTLPSPNARDWKGPRVPGSRPGDLLPDTIEKLLPTPKTPTGGPENRASKKRRGSGGANLEGSLGDLTQLPSDDGRE